MKLGKELLTDGYGKGKCIVCGKETNKYNYYVEPTASKWFVWVCSDECVREYNMSDVEKFLEMVNDG